MTEDKFHKLRFKSYMPITFNRPETKHMRPDSIDCMLIGIDFEQGLLRLVPFPNQKYEEEPVWVRYEYCELTKPKLKVNGK